MSERLLLDTCAVIWAAQDDSLADLASEAIDDAWQRGEALRVSPISAWEIGLLVARGRLRLSRAPLNWFEDFVATARAEVVPLTPRRSWSLRHFCLTACTATRLIES